MKQTIKSLKKLFGCKNMTDFAEFFGMGLTPLYDMQRKNADKYPARLYLIIEKLIDELPRRKVKKILEKIRLEIIADKHLPNGLNSVGSKPTHKEQHCEL
jgi:hypothetical protein